MLPRSVQFGPYELVERLAVGGMAEVFLAVRGGAEGFRRHVVLKRILPQHAADPEFQTLFADEARLGGLLHHPNIVQMFDYDRIDGVAYLAMEYVAGHDLRFVLKHAPGLPLAGSLAIALAVLDGLGYAHSLEESGRRLNVVHRDISPANVLLSWDGQIKIADFGVARAEIAEHRTRGGELKGKIPYLSPEQIVAKPIDGRSDLFSWGVLLYQLLTGVRPFDGDSEVVILDRIAHGDFLPPTRVTPDLPAALEPVVMKALAVAPDERFQSAGEASSALRAAAATAGVVPSVEAIREHLAKLRATAPAAGDEARPTPAAGKVLTVPDRTPSKPGHALGDAETVVDRRATSPAEAAAPPEAPAAPTRQRPRRTAWIVASLVALAAIAVVALQPGPRQAERRARDAGAAVAPADDAPLVVVMRMAEQQEGWFLKNLLHPWARSAGRRVRIVRFGDVPELPRVLREAGQADVVKVPLAAARALVEAGLVRSITRLVGESDLTGGLDAVTAGFDPRALELCRYPTIVGRELFFVPRKVEVKFLVYDEAAVRAAVAAFPGLALALEEDLVRLTGHGLPRGFVLEPDPEEWDWYDLLAVAYAMARTPDARGRTMPRVARRTHPYWGTVSTVLDMLRALGQPDAAIGDTPAMRDLVAWEALYRELGLYHPAVYSDEQVLSGRGLYEAMQRGEVQMTTTHSLGVRLLAGLREQGIPNYLEAGGAGLGLATLPRGVSLELGADGAPVRSGARQGFVDGWLWGIPTSAPDPERSLALLRHLTARPQAERETRAFLIEPVRTDVTWGDEPLAKRVAAVTRRQEDLDAGARVPAPTRTEDLANMRDQVDRIWRDLVVARTPGQAGIDEAAIARGVSAALAR